MHFADECLLYTVHRVIWKLGAKVMVHFVKQLYLQPDFAKLLMWKHKPNVTHAVSDNIYCSMGSVYRNGGQIVSSSVALEFYSAMLDSGRGDYRDNSSPLLHKDLLGCLP